MRDHPIKEPAVDVNPIDLQKHLKGVSYPASKEDLLSTAQSNDAPSEVLDALRGLSGTDYGGPDDVMAALR